MEIWLPERAKPAYTCRVCHKPFYSEERTAWERHVVQCATERRDALMETSPYERMPALMRSWDPELDDWLADHPGGW